MDEERERVDEEREREWMRRERVDEGERESG